MTTVCDLIKQMKTERFFRWMRSVLDRSEASRVEDRYCPRLAKKYFCFHTHPKIEYRMIPPLVGVRPEARFYFSYPDLILNLKTKPEREAEYFTTKIRAALEEARAPLTRIGDCILYHDENDEPILKCLPAMDDLPPIIEELREKYLKFIGATEKWDRGEISKEELIAIFNDYIDLHVKVDKELNPCKLNIAKVKP
jgi:hypothetical protein